MVQYAAQTSVPAAKSRDEIEQILTRYGATGFQYGWMDDGKKAAIQFDYPVKEKGQISTVLRIRFLLDMPDKNDPEFTTRKVRGGSTRPRERAVAEKLHEQAKRQRWRALLLVVKAKLEAVESGISSIENEFLAHIVLPGGRTVAEWLVPQLQEAYETKKLPPLLPGATKDK